jgi:hypothetical protein
MIHFFITCPDLVWHVSFTVIPLCVSPRIIIFQYLLFSFIMPFANLWWQAMSNVFLLHPSLGHIIGFFFQYFLFLGSDCSFCEGVSSCDECSSSEGGSYSDILGSDIVILLFSLSEYKASYVVN